MQTIYVDVLIVLNIYVNYFLLRITAVLTHSRLRARRCIAAAAYGSLYSLLIFVPSLSGWLLFLIKSAAAVSITALAFGVGGRGRLLKNTIVFFTVNFVLAGAVYAVYSWLKPQAVHFANSFFYIDFSLAVLIVTTAALYIAVRIVTLHIGTSPGEGTYSVRIKYGERSIALSGIADTGNALVDCFSGAPVIICDESSSPELTGYKADACELPHGFRLIPCSTVSESGLIPVFRPDEVVIRDETSGTEKRVDALIGFGKSGGEAIFNPRLLKL